MANGFAALVNQRSSGQTKRRRLDDYETPSRATEVLFRIHGDFQGPILEPACGSGRMVIDIKKRFPKVRVTGTDIKQGDDFLARKKHWPGDIITNPPYRDGLADAFVHHALEIADGRVAMLMRSGYLFGEARALALYGDYPPESIIIIPERIYFLVNNKPIKSQFYNHVWIVWPSRQTRDDRDYSTHVYWP